MNKSNQNQEILKIALAGYLHDIGKFAERAYGGHGSGGKLKIAFYPDEKFLNDNASRYQPQYDGHFSHRHALFTAALIDQLEEIFPPEFNSANWGLTDPLINLAAAHHKPETPLEWIIAVADRIASGWDRDSFEKYNRQAGDFTGYKKVRLLPLFEALSTKEVKRPEKESDFSFRYALKELSPLYFFPEKADICVPQDSKKASMEYQRLFESFVLHLEKIEHRDNPALWFEHFDSLFLIHAANIPAATVPPVIPDVSLYDHCRVTSALASALFQFHHETQTLEADRIREFANDATQRFLLIQGDFHGIQDFIFSHGGSTGKSAAKLLRGRSFYVSMLSELAADFLTRKLELPITSVVLNAAGKFTILAGNTVQTKIRTQEVEKAVNSWLLKHFFGQVSVGISFVGASCKDFVSKNFEVLMARMAEKAELKKFQRFDPFENTGVFKGFLDSFSHEGFGLCPYCGKRPASKDGEIQHGKEDPDFACLICSDQLYIGESLVKEPRIAITKTGAELHGRHIQIPIFDEYLLSFDVSGKLKDLARQGQLLKYWDISISEKGEISRDFTAKFLNGYVPKYSEEDNQDDRLLHGKKSEKTQEELIESVKNGLPKTFLHLAKKALNFTGKTGQICGIEALGVLKADVDNLGLLFSCGLPQDRQSLSRTATLSRQLNFFFAVFIPFKLKIEPAFKEIYTVFAGGDDLFLIGPWNKIISFASFLQKSFAQYVCNNPEITISAGITVEKPDEPVYSISWQAEEALHSSKTGGRNALTLFGETVTWESFLELEERKNTLEKWLDEGFINTATLYRFHHLAAMARQESILKRENLEWDQEDFEALKWRARFKYTVVRNTGKQLKKEVREKAIFDVLQACEWLSKHHGGMKIPIWQILYNKRGS